jgi:hypothetical protein
MNAFVMLWISSLSQRSLSSATRLSLNFGPVALRHQIALALPLSENNFNVVEIRYNMFLVNLYLYITCQVCIMIMGSIQ